MSSNINTVLADCEKQAQQLITEIEKFRSAGKISEETTKTLVSLCDALTETQNRIKPFTEVFVRRTLYLVGAAFILNICLSLSILILTLVRNN